MDAQAKLTCMLGLGLILNSPSLCDAEPDPSRHIVAWGEGGGSRPDIEASFRTGLKLGLDGAGTIRNHANSSDPSWAGAARLANEMLSMDPQATVIVGMPFSDQPRGAATVLDGHRVMCFFPMSGETAISEFGPWFQTTGGTMRGLVEDCLSLCEQRYPGKRGLMAVLEGPKAAQTIRDAFVAGMKEAAWSFEMPPVVLDEQGRLPRSAIDEIEAEQVDFVFFTMPPRFCNDAISQLVAAERAVPVFAASSWTSSGVGTLQPQVNELREEVVSLGTFIPGLSSTAEFETSMASEGASYQLDPQNYVAASHGYDIGVMIRTTIDRMGDASGPEAFYQAFYRDPRFDATSTGLRLINENGGAADRPSDYVRYDRETGRWDRLPEPLKAPSRLRFEHRLRELSPPIPGRASAPRDQADF